MDLFAKIVYCSKSLTILTYFPYSHVYSLHSHSHPIPRVPTLIRRISLIQFPILASTDSFLSLYSLRIYFRKIVALVQKWTLPFLLLHNSRHQIIIYIIYDVISVITKNYLPYSASSKKYIICEVWANNSEWRKCYLSFMSKRGTFFNLCQFTKIYLTNFVPSWFCFFYFSFLSL